MSHKNSENMWSDMRFKRTDNVPGLQKGFLDIKPMKRRKNLTSVVLLEILFPTAFPTLAVLLGASELEPETAAART